MLAQRIICLIWLFCGAAASQAQAPAVAQPVPPLVIEDRGELLLNGDTFSYSPWRVGENPARVHILQYFGATRSDSKLFRPFTDRLQETFERGQYHITTIINLDAALWGTAGMVLSEVKDSKREHPGSTMVLDENGTGASQWQLGDRGAGLLIVDAQGVVRYFTQNSMSEDELGSSVDLVRQQLEACLKSC